MTPPFFKPHGSAQVERSGAILTVHMRGDWNAEMRDQTGKAMMKHAPTLNAAGPWGIINCLHDTLVYSEDIYTNTRLAYAARPPGSRLAAVAFVIGPQVEAASLMRPRFENLLDGIIPSGVFTDYAKAQEWLQAQLQAK
ncbi:hypothetical protein [Rhodoferax saidenbachensis]|nr:hypothetical protein [Rhodoferax saidenbachensis]